ncbi:hypothetical protein [Streptomyces fragilis]|uniref:Integral membrane protein n=2 Tax=Streptomyces fragilis TaxID=67301 RepID=A0ABV2YKI2_9ACTN|nr:hypothetical protein [Streptomyces fragilis]
MPRLSWTMEQRATVKRYMLLATLFTVAGVALGVFLVASGNAGGWVVLGMCLCMWSAGALLVGSVRRDQP